MVRKPESPHKSESMLPIVYFCCMVDIVLKKGKEKAVLHRHPWLFSGAIERVKGKPADGDIVRLLNEKGDFMAYGFYNGQSRVALRLLEWDESAEIDDRHSDPFR